MSNVKYIVTTQSIVVSYDGERVVLKPSDKLYKAALDCIKSKQVDKLPDVLRVKKTRVLKDGISVDSDGVYYLDDVVVPAGMQPVIERFLLEDLPLAPIIAFTRKLMKNTSLRSREMLYKFLEHNGHPLTDDGCFIAYKKVSKDFRDIRSNRFDNSVGKTVEMPREQVNDNPNETCSAGLHVCAWEYLGNFGASDDPVMEVEIDPADVVAVPNDYNGTKMRVCKYVVVSQLNAPKTETLKTKPKLQPSPLTQEEIDNLDDDDMNLDDDEDLTDLQDLDHAACTCDDCVGATCDCVDEDDDFDDEDDEKEARESVITIQRVTQCRAAKDTERNKKATFSSRELGLDGQVSDDDYVEVVVKHKVKRKEEFVSLFGNPNRGGKNLYVSWDAKLGTVGLVKDGEAAKVFVEKIIVTHND